MIILQDVLISILQFSLIAILITIIFVIFVFDFISIDLF